MAKKKVIEVQAPVRILHLPYPTRLDGGKNTVIVKQVTKKYANIMILKPGTEEVHATIKSENGAGDNLDHATFAQYRVRRRRRSAQCTAQSS